MIKIVLIAASLLLSTNAHAFVDQAFQSPKCVYLDEGLAKVEKQGQTYKGYINNQLIFQGSMDLVLEAERATLTSISNSEFQIVIQMKDSTPYLVLIDEIYETVNGVEKLISTTETFISMFSCS